MRILIVLALLAACDGGRGDDADGATDESTATQPQTGTGGTVFTAGADPDNPFFRSLGTNDRTCESCHAESAGWSLSPALLALRFTTSLGADPVFRPIDGANAPELDVSSDAARTAAFSVLLTKGLIRVGLAVPDDAEFTLEAVDDPYGHASAAELSLFRRPLPATNLKFLSQIMWDTREPSLVDQATNATIGHAQAASIDDSAILSIVSFESSIFTAQATDDIAGALDDGARGGPQALSEQIYPAAGRGFSLYGAWLATDTSTAAGARRASIARGERIFNTRRFDIRGVAGLPDQDGTCSTCHDTPNVGDHSSALPLDIGISDAGRRTADLPLYTLRNKTDGRTVRTTDPGLALVTGRWSDIGRFKVPVLRGLAMRPPYFHNGLAPNLGAVLRFYRQRFGFRIGDDDEADLIAFLSAL